MQGKSVFTKAEADLIRSLIRKKVISDKNEQKKIRAKIRKLGFWASEFNLAGGYTESDFLHFVTITDVNGKTQQSHFNQNLNEDRYQSDNKGNMEKKSGELNLKVSFAPLYSSDARILILGTMPGEKSLSLNQYYGHGGNQFWPIMFECLNERFSANYEDKKKLLINNQIAIWDVLSHCERKGSSDSSIKNEIPNDLANFCKSLPNLRYILFNGSRPYNIYWKHNEANEAVDYFILPSTSAANTRMTKQGKTEKWKEMMNFVR